MNRRELRILTTALSVAVWAQQALPALAFRPPVGAVSGTNKLMQGVTSNPDDLAYSPLLLQMAKLIGRTGLSPVFFLQNDGGFSDEPSIDLRTLLLYQAGLIKMPIRIITGKRTTEHAEPVLTLSVPAIPEPHQDLAESPAASNLPSLETPALPREMERDQVVTPHANIGQPERISIAAQADAPTKPKPAPMLSFDVSRLKADLGLNGKNEPEPTQLVAEYPHLAMAMPRTTTMPFITRNMFRLWTWRTDSADEESQAGDLPTATAASFNGTFVVASTGVIKSITGRHFQLAPGRLLANNQGGELLFQTDLAEISVEPEATVALEVVGTSSGGKSVKVYALESAAGRSVSVRLPGNDKPINLNAGEVLLVGDHLLTDADFAQSHMESRCKVNPKIARGTFGVDQFIEKELMLKSQSTTDGEQYSALNSLKKRVSEQR